MTDKIPSYFQPQQAREVADAFARFDVEYMFIGKSGAILLGFPSATQDVDLFVKKSRENGARIVLAVESIGFGLDDRTRNAIKQCNDFVQLKDGPFDLDLVFAPDGIEDFDKAKERMYRLENFRIANLQDIIASKRASGREKDLIDLPMLEDFAEEFAKNERRPPRTALEIALEKTKDEN